MTEWIKILKCPITGQDLKFLDHESLNQINVKISSGEIWQAGGKVMNEEISSGLTNYDNTFIYPINSGVVLLLPDLAISSDYEKMKLSVLSDDKLLVKNFYDNRGWQTTASGNYEDAKIFEDLRPFVQEYLSKCHNRVCRFLNNSGKYLLDAASGALQYEDYLQYSKNYNYRICVDLSFQGLVECKRKLGDKAICLLCDMTNLPIKEGVIDGFISLNTIYHIPKDEQVKAIQELNRVLMHGGKGVVVYDWYKHSLWMNFTLLPFRGYEFLKNRINSLLSKAKGKGEPPKMLYFHAHNIEYFKNNLGVPFSVFCWRSISVPFMKVYIHKWLFGKRILNSIYNLEEKKPELCGLNGEYPMFVFSK